MIKINYDAVYGDEGYKVTWKKTGHGKACIKLTQTCDDEGDIETFVFFIKLSTVILEGENGLIIRNQSDMRDPSEYEFVPADRGKGFQSMEEAKAFEFEIAKKHINSCGRLI